MKTTLLKKSILIFTMLASVLIHAQSVTFDSSTVTIDTNGKILMVDGADFDSATNPVKFSQVDIPAGAGTMFATIRVDYVVQTNWNGGTNISASKNTTLNSGTASGLIVGSPASAFDLTEVITIGQSNLTLALRCKTSSGPNVFVGAGISVTVVATLGVEDYQQLEGVNIYPNPASDVLKITCPEGSKVGVYSLLGVKVKSIEKASGNFNMEVSNLAKGLYIVKVESEGKFYSKKIQIK